MKKEYHILIALAAILLIVACTQAIDSDENGAVTGGTVVDTTIDENEGAPADEVDDILDDSLETGEEVPEEGIYHISIVEGGFEPREATVSLGTTVVWTNNDKTIHTVTSDNGTYLKSNNILVGETYEREFNSKGVFAYHSIFKVTYRASIRVE